MRNPCRELVFTWLPDSVLFNGGNLFDFNQLIDPNPIIFPFADNVDDNEESINLVELRQEQNNCPVINWSIQIAAAYTDNSGSTAYLTTE